MQLTSGDIQKLISLGRTDKNPDNVLLAHFRKRDFVNRQHGEAWREMVKEISDKDLVDIFKGLITLEREIKWMGGSAAGAIWVYDVINQRGLDKEHIIADYGFSNCDNAYIPFGRSYHGERTSKEYFSYQNHKSEIRSVRAERYDKILKRVEGRKSKRIEAIAELRKLSKEQREEILKKLLESHASLTANQRLEVIANDLKFPPEYYPVEWIKLSPEEIQKLPIDLIKKLYDKLSTKTKGHWKRFANELEKLDDGI